MSLREMPTLVVFVLLYRTQCVEVTTVGSSSSWDGWAGSQGVLRVVTLSQGQQHPEFLKVFGVADVFFFKKIGCRCQLVGPLCVLSLVVVGNLSAQDHGSVA